MGFLLTGPRRARGAAEARRRSRSPRKAWIIAARTAGTRARAARSAELAAASPSRFSAASAAKGCSPSSAASSAASAADTAAARGQMLVPRHQRQRQQQFVLDQLAQVERAASAPARRPRCRRRAPRPASSPRRSGDCGCDVAAARSSAAGSAGSRGRSAVSAPQLQRRSAAPPPTTAARSPRADQSTDLRRAVGRQRQRVAAAAAPGVRSGQPPSSRPSAAANAADVEPVRVEARAGAHRRQCRARAAGASAPDRWDNPAMPARR